MAYTTRESVAALSKPDPEFQAFLDATPMPPRDFSDIPRLRSMRDEQERQGILALGGPPASVIETKEKISARDGFSLEELIWKPSQPGSSGAPLIVLIHGGGFCLASPSQMTGTARALVHLYGAVVVSLKYRLAPEHKFPTAPQDCWDGLVWASTNAKALGADLAKGFILGGVSAGGAMTAALGQMSLAGGLPAPLTGLWLSIPVVMDESNFEKGQVDAKYKELWFAHEQNKDAPFLDRTAVDAFMSAYQQKYDSEWATPFAVENAHKGLPKSYVQVCGMDPLRDDGLIYEKVLKENGVETRLDVYPGLPHASWAFVPKLKTSQSIQGDILRAFGWLLGTEEKDDAAIGAAGA